ncbi:MAG: Fic family protein [Bdellovibrionales bacterium]|nr:Fic family protein [Bdellovibrionales bacterium]
MKWNWQQHEWPRFWWDDQGFSDLEAQFLRQAGTLVGTSKHLHDDDLSTYIVDAMTSEALMTSEIEGEYLNRDSVRSSILQEMGLKFTRRRVGSGEKGIADLVIDLHRTYNQAITHQKLFTWHAMVVNERTDIANIGQYRRHSEPIQVVSGNVDNPKIHFEGPPSKDVPAHMEAFIEWWEQSHPRGRKPVSTVIRPGIAHLYFVCIHPFEDGNGRIARALAEKALAESLDSPSLISLSQTIHQNRKEYYKQLAQNNQSLDITGWLHYFAQTIIAAQKNALQSIEFIIEKTKFFDRYANQLNERQTKVLLRLFREGPAGFEGGLNAENYIQITGTSRATATRDLQDLVKKSALRKTGTLKSTRYHLVLLNK